MPSGPAYVSGCLGPVAACTVLYIASKHGTLGFLPLGKFRRYGSGTTPTKTHACRSVLWLSGQADLQELACGRCSALGWYLFVAVTCVFISVTVRV